MMMLEVGMVQTSCGMNGPFFDFAAERYQLTRWAEAKGEKGLEEVQALWLDRVAGLWNG